MLDIVAIKSTPKATDASPEKDKRPAAREPADDARQEFQSEYEAANDADTKPTGNADEKAEPENEKQTAEQEQPDIKDTPRDTPKVEAEVPSDFEKEPEMAISATSGKANSTAGASKSEQNQPPAVQVKSEPKPAEIAKVQPEGEALQKAETPEDPRLNIQTKNTEAAKAPTKAAAETVVMSRAVTNAREAATTKEAGPLPSDAKSASPVAVANRAIPQQGPNSAQPETAMTPALQKSDRSRKAEVELRMTPSRPEAKKVVTNAKQNLAPKVTAVDPGRLANLQMAKDKNDLSGLVSGDLEPVGPWETRTLAQTTSSGFAQTLGRAETPGMIARQMAEALQRLPDRPVEISLNPRELGRVRMSISAAEAGITVNVVAERPETLDLMRRNIEQLTREFESIGYESINFAFAEGEARNEFSDEPEGDRGQDVSRLDLTAEEPSQDEPLAQAAATTGVDIRL